MKKVTLILFALAVAMFSATAFASDITLAISFDGTNYTTLCTQTAASNPACVNAFYTNGSGLNITAASAFSNSPGTASLATSSTTSLNIAYTGAGPLTFYLRDTANGFTLPNQSPFTFDVSQSATTPVGMFSFVTTGSVIGGAGCSVTTDPISNGGGFKETATSCSYSTPFTLEAVTTYTLSQGASLESTATMTATVPEPTSMMLLGSGLLGLAGTIRRKLGK